MLFEKFIPILCCLGLSFGSFVVGVKNTTWRKLKDLTTKKFNNEQKLNHFIIWTRNHAS